MSPQDTQMLQDFLGQLVQAHGIQKDQEADALIQRAVAQQPDAAYLLVQRALLVGQALDNAKGRIAALERQLQQAQSGQQGGGKFLDADSWGNSGAARPAAQDSPRDAQPQYQPGQYQPQAQGQYQPQYQPQYQQPPRSGFLSGGLGSTLGTVATTAAGVAAGGFLFQGLESMFNHKEHGGESGSSHLLGGDDQGSNNLFSDQSGSSLANQAGVSDVDRATGGGGQGLFDADNTSIDGGDGFFDGDGSDEGLFS